MTFTEIHDPQNDREPFPFLADTGEAIIRARRATLTTGPLDDPWFHRWPHVLISIAGFVRRHERPDTLAFNWWVYGLIPVRHPESSISGEYIRGPTGTELNAALGLRNDRGVLVARVFHDVILVRDGQRASRITDTFVEAEWVLKNLIDAAVAERRQR